MRHYWRRLASRWVEWLGGESVVVDVRVGSEGAVAEAEAAVVEAGGGDDGRGRGEDGLAAGAGGVQSVLLLLDCLQLKKTKFKLN